MKVRKALATASIAGLLSAGFAGTASAAPQVQQNGVAGGLVAAVVNANVQNVDIDVIDGDVNVALTNVLNNNRILTNFLNNSLNQNTVTVTDVVDVAVVGNTLVIGVLSSSTVANLAGTDPVSL